MKNKFWEFPLPPGITLFWVDKTGSMLFWGPETSDMTFKGLGEMFEGDSADMFTVDGGPSGWSQVHRPGSEDPRQR